MTTFDRTNNTYTVEVYIKQVAYVEVEGATDPIEAAGVAKKCVINNLSAKLHDIDLTMGVWPAPYEARLLMGTDDPEVEIL
jgi:hypothetical protein